MVLSEINSDNGEKDRGSQEDAHQTPPFIFP
jgi:hypothetical protein